MNRRSFLSWVGLGVVAAIIPAPIKVLIEKVLQKRWAGPIVVDSSGIGDFKDIQSAINALPAEGGTIFVMPGLYDVVNIENKPVWIAGLGNGRKTVTLVPGSVARNTVIR